MEIIDTFENYGIKLPYRRRTGQVKCVCPECKRKGERSHPEDKSLSVDLDGGVWNCHYCGWSGRLKGYSGIKAKRKKNYVRPASISESGLSQRAVNYFAYRGINISTLKKMHIAEGKEFMPQAGKEMNTIQFPYYLEGELINIKYRTGDKKFKLYKDAELIPYNIDGIKDKEECFFVEGEFDALSLIEVGIDNVVSVPNGANANLEWLDDFLEGWFDDKKNIIIAVDNDEKGKQLKDELTRRFGPERCMTVEWSAGCKDANDELRQNGKQSLLARLQSAQDVKIGGVLTLDDYELDLDRLYSEGAPKGLTVGLPDLDELISFTTKRIMIVTGIPSHGKSQWMVEIAVRLNLRYGWRAAFFSPESQPIESHAQELIQVIIGKSFNPRYLHMNEFEYRMGKNYVRENFFHIMPEEDQKIATIIEKAQYLVRRKGIKMLVIDPYSSVDVSFGSMSETNYIREMLEELRKFSVRNDCLVCLVAHPTKIRKDNNSEGVPTMYDVSGSAHFLNKADYGIVVHRYKEENYTMVRVEKVKSRFLGQKGDAFFKFNINNGRYTPWDKERPGEEAEWDNTNWLVPYNEQVNQQQETQTNDSIQQSPKGNQDFLSDASNDCPF